MRCFNSILFCIFLWAARRNAKRRTKRKHEEESSRPILKKKTYKISRYVHIWCFQLDLASNLPFSLHSRSFYITWSRAFSVSVRSGCVCVCVCWKNVEHELNMKIQFSIVFTWCMGWCVWWCFFLVTSTNNIAHIYFCCCLAWHKNIETHWKTRKVMEFIIALYDYSCNCC